MPKPVPLTAESITRPQLQTVCDYAELVGHHELHRTAHAALTVHRDGGPGQHAARGVIANYINVKRLSAQQ